MAATEVFTTRAEIVEAVRKARERYLKQIDPGPFFAEAEKQGINPHTCKRIDVTPAFFQTLVLHDAYETAIWGNPKSNWNNNGLMCQGVRVTAALPPSSPVDFRFVPKETA